MYQSIKKYLEKLSNNKHSAFIVLLICLIMLHVVINLDYGDDLQFSKVLSGNNIFQWTFVRYETWSSRIVVDFVMAFVLGVNSILWKIVDIAMIIILALSMSKLFIEDKNNNWIIVAFLALYPLKDMRSAGWGTTTINYLWPLALGMYSLVVCIKILKEEKVKNYEYILSVLATIYACSVEQMCGILVFTYFLMTAFMAFKKKINLYIIFSLIISAINLIVIILCPGNSLRKLQEMSIYFVDFDKLSFLSKVELGFSSSIAKLVFEPSAVFIVFALLLGILVLIRNNSLIKRVIGFIPLMAGLFIGIGCTLLKKFAPNSPNIIDSMTKYGIIDLWNYNKMSSYFPLILLIIISLCILISIYYCFGKTLKTLVTSYILIIGFISRVIMGFSPTIWASNDRTFIFMYFSIIIIGIILYEEIYKYNFIIIKYINKMIIILAIILFTKLLFYTILSGIFVNKENLINFIKSKLH
jgi:hypothetical protein